MKKKYLYLCPQCGNVSENLNEDTSVLCIKCDTILNINNRMSEFETIFINKPTSRMR